MSHFYRSRRAVLNGLSATVGLTLAGCLSRPIGSTEGNSSESDGERSSGGNGVSGERLLWERRIEGPPKYYFTVQPDNRGIVGQTTDGEAFAFDPDGTLRWSNRLAGGIVHVSNNYVVLYVGASGEIAALEPATGGQIRTLHSLNEAESLREVGQINNRLFLLTRQIRHGSHQSIEQFDRLYCISEQDGEKHWQRNLPFRREWEWELGVTPDAVLAMWGRGQIHAFGPDGTEQWRYGLTNEVAESDDASIDPSFVYNSGHYRDGTYFLGARERSLDERGRVLALRTRDGSLRWRRDGADNVLEVGSLVYCAYANVSDGTIEGRDPADGRTEWTAESGRSWLTDSGALANDILYVSSMSSSTGHAGTLVQAFHAPTGNERGTFSTSQELILAPVVAENRVFVATGTDNADTDGTRGTIHALAGIHVGGEW